MATVSETLDALGVKDWVLRGEPKKCRRVWSNVP